MNEKNANNHLQVDRKHGQVSETRPSSSSNVDGNEGVNVTAKPKRKKFVEKLRRSSSETLYHVATNVGNTDIGIDGVLGLELVQVVAKQKELKKAIENRQEFKIQGWVWHFADMEEEHKFQLFWRRKSVPSAVCVISFLFYLYKGFVSKTALRNAMNCIFNNLGTFRYRAVYL